MSLPTWIKQHIAANPNKILARLMRSGDPDKKEAYAAGMLRRYEHFIALEQLADAHHRLSKRIAALEHTKAVFHFGFPKVTGIISSRTSAKWSGNPFQQKRAG